RYINDQAIGKFWSQLKSQNNMVLGTRCGRLLWGNVTYGGSFPDFYKAVLSSNVYQTRKFDLIIFSPTLYDFEPMSMKQLITIDPTWSFKTNANTYYAIHFGPNTGVTCSGYCAYHSGVWIGDIAKQTTNELIFGVMPDLNGCNCGGGSVFDTQTTAAAHELIEAVTRY
ncbi:hypothetical protein HDU76_004046, partial [Blyttiomyces sp. JEL0837]